MSDADPWRTAPVQAPINPPPQRKSYSAMTTPEKWAWHTEVYAFRRVVLDAREGEPSPCDPGGQWYNAALVDVAVRRLIEKRDGAKRRRQFSEDDQRQGRAAINAWARAHGQPDIDAYAEAAGVSLGEAYEAGIHSMIDRIVAEKKRKFGYPRQHISDVRVALGLTAKEYRPTAEEMRRGRVELGLEAEADPA